MSMELVIKSAEVIIPQAIENIEQLKTELTPKLEHYKSLVVTEDSIKAAKADKANLNKLRKAIDERRIEVKKQVMGIYEPLEKQCKELTALIDAPISAIDKQIKNFDDIRKQEKYDELKDFFVSINNLDFLKIEDVLNPKWGNVGSKIENLKENMVNNIKKISDDYNDLKSIYHDSPLLTSIVQKFEETKDKSGTLAYAAIIEKRYQAEQEEKAKEKAQLEYQKSIINKSAEIPDDVKITEPIEQIVSSESKIIGTFKVRCTKSQLIALRDFMRDNGIEFKTIKSNGGN